MKKIPEEDPTRTNVNPIVPMPESSLQKVNIPRELDALDAFWSQNILGAANGTLIKAAKGVGHTTWHAHDDQDEVFIVYEGRLTVETRAEQVELDEGDMLVVPKGTEHRTGAAEAAKFVILGIDVTSTPDGGKPAWSETSDAEP